MSDLKNAASASSSSAQQEASSENTTPKGSPPPNNISNLGGEATFTGNVLRGSYSLPGCELKDEQVKIKLDDGRVVGSVEKAARDLRYMVGCWQDDLALTVTMYGMTDIIKRVELGVEVEVEEAEA